MILKEVLQRSASWLDGKGIPSARREAELLWAHVLKTDRVGLYTGADRPLTEDELEACRALLRRRASGEPIAYITGAREFYGLAMHVTRDVLVPRPETELLVDRARELKPATLLDVGTGSGCIAIACKKQMPACAVTATDVSGAALEVASQNAARHEAEVEFRCGDLFEPLDAGARFDLIVSNPPYVPVGQAEAVAKHEPHGALFAGTQGLDVIARLVGETPSRLADGGTLLVEIGEDQADAVREIAAAHFTHVEIHPDLAGLPRVLEAR